MTDQQPPDGDSAAQMSFDLGSERTTGDADAAAVLADTVASADRTGRNDLGELIVQTSTPHVEIQPGGRASVVLDVTNVGEAIDGLTAVVDGIDPDWVSTDRPMIAVFPDETEQVVLTLDVPTSCPAGDYLVVVRFLSALGVGREGAQDFWLRVGRRVDVTTSLRPQIVRGGKTATIIATVENRGNASTPMRVTAIDPTRETTCLVDPGGFHLPQGGSAQVIVDLEAKRPWFGQTLARSIQITTVADPHEANPIVDEQIATFNQKPRIPRGLVTALILAGIILLWALIFLLAINRLNRTEAPAKALGSSFTEAPERIPLDVIAASAAGTVSASTTGEGVPRATVEALSRGADGTLTSVASAASGAEGIYEIPTLLPGEYLIRVSAEGYRTQWYPGVDSSDQAEPVSFSAGAPMPGLDVALPGETGRLLAAIDVPPEAAGQPLTVTVTQQMDGAASSADSGTADANGASDASDAGDASNGAAPMTATVTTTDGTIDVDGLTAPATYDVRVEGDGFDTIEFEQEVKPGTATVADSVAIGASDGALAGTVFDGSGRGLGGVTISVRSGDSVQTTTSATSDGTFRVVDLVTPGTYVISFTRDGFAPVSQALELGPGESNESVGATMIGGLGTIDGVVRSVDGTALGGITVDVVGDGFSQTTATLTAAGAGTVVGGFTLRDLPVPGAYTVSFESNGYLVETRDAVFDDAGTVRLGDVVMVPSTVRISGTVRSGTAGLAQATVSLSNGETAVSTLSATNPTGTFAFDGVVAGTYTLNVSANGFVARTILLRVVPGAPIVSDVTLQPEAAASASLNPPLQQSSALPAPADVDPSTLEVAPTSELFGLPSWTGDE